MDGIEELRSLRRGCWDVFGGMLALPLQVLKMDLTAFLVRQTFSVYQQNRRDMGEDVQHLAWKFLRKANGQLLGFVCYTMEISLDSAASLVTLTTAHLMV